MAFYFKAANYGLEEIGVLENLSVGIAPKISRFSEFLATIW